MKMEKLVFSIFTTLFLIKTILTDNLRLYDTSGDIAFTKIIEYKIVLKDFQGEVTDFFLKHAFVSIKVDVSTNCTEKTCSQPIRVYGRLNEAPKPEDKLFDKKDINGRFENGIFKYGFEYSPCQLNKDDVVYIQLVGIEGKAQFKLNVNYNFMKNYRVVCTIGEQPKKSLYSSSANTDLGTIHYGGIFNNTIDDELYLLNQTEWVRLTQSGSNRPEPRYGHFMTHFDNYLIVFAGKDTNENNLNDLWLYSLNNNEWINIDYKNKTNAPSPRFLPSGELVVNHGRLILFGNKDTEDHALYFLDLKILFQIIDYQKQKDIDYDSKLHKLWTRYEAKDILSRYGLTITHLGGDEVMFFGGFDKSGYALARQEIMNLNTLEVRVIERDAYPQARGFHGMLRRGSILMLYGGKIGSGENLNDLWKFIIDTKKWIKVEETKDDMFYLYKSGFIFTKLEGSERPVIFDGEDNNREIHNEVIVMDFDICPTDTNILDVTDCLPCAEGYELSRQMKCEACQPGTYLNIDRKLYSNSKCEMCPIRTYNPKEGQSDISSCLICPYQTFNDKTGITWCNECESENICLPGSTKQLTDEFLIKNINTAFVDETNYPEYADKNKLLKRNSVTLGIIIVSSVCFVCALILAIMYKVKKAPVIRFLINIDFLPLTGGTDKKCNGGLITIIYTILILSLTFSFVFRYIYFNEIVEVIPLSQSTNQEVDIESSIKLDVDLIGYNFACTDNKLGNGLYTCDKDIEAKIINSKGTVGNSIFCSISNEGYCRVSLLCEDCRNNNSVDSISIKLKNEDAFVQVYKWHFQSIWDVVLNKSKGYSDLKGIAQADSKIE
jgi:hypothetical protein